MHTHANMRDRHIHVLAMVRNHHRFQRAHSRICQEQAANQGMSEDALLPTRHSITNTWYYKEEVQLPYYVVTVGLGYNCHDSVLYVNARQAVLLHMSRHTFHSREG